MSQHGLIQGSLFRSTERKTAKSGREFVKGTLKVGGREGEGSVFWSIICFSEVAADELMHLSDGDIISVQGALKVEMYKPDAGEPKISHTIFADQVLALKQPKKARELKQKMAPKSDGHGDRRSAAPQSTQSRFGQRERDLDDDIPF